MTVTADEKNLAKLGRFFVGRAFKTNDELQEFADQMGIMKFLVRFAIAEYNFLGDVYIEIEVENEEIDRRVDDMLEAARLTCHLKR